MLDKSKSRNRIPTMCLLLLTVAAANVPAQSNIQTVFNLESGVRNEVSISDDVIAVLKSDERVDQCFRQKAEGARESEWFAASEIDLNGDGLKDLIIKAKDSCLFGANQGPFWIFQRAPDGYLKVFSASGLQLAVLPEKFNSFNQIKISKIVRMKPASRIYSFKSGKYQTRARR